MAGAVNNARVMGLPKPDWIYVSKMLALSHTSTLGVSYLLFCGLVLSLGLCWVWGCVAGAVVLRDIANEIIDIFEY